MMLTAVMHVTIFNAGFAIFALLGRSKDTYPIAKPVRPAFARAPETIRADAVSPFASIGRA
jgi:hypothetical protein